MIDKHILRALVLEVMNSDPKTQINSVIEKVGNLVVKQNLLPSREECEKLGIDYKYYENQRLNPVDKFEINKIIWDLIVERIVTPGINTGNTNLPFLSVTEFGQNYISQTPPHYYDPEGYMDYVKSVAPNLDPVIEQYLSESLHCFRRQLFFASAVMLGAAAEKAVLLLLKAIADSMRNVDKKNETEQLLERPRLPSIFEMIRETLSPLVTSNTIPYGVHQGCIEHLTSLFEMVRVQRNDAVHPTFGQVDRGKVFISLQTLPAGLESIDRLTGWLQSNSIS